MCASGRLQAVRTVLLLGLHVPFLGFLPLACKTKLYVWGTSLALLKAGAKGNVLIDEAREIYWYLKLNQCTA